MRTKEEVLEDYNKKLKLWEEKNLPIADTKTMSSQDVMLVYMSLHRCNNQKFKDITGELMKFIAENKVITSDDVLHNNICTLPAFYRRVQVLKKSNLIRRESRIYYLATPRLAEFIKHFERISKYG